MPAMWCGRSFLGRGAGRSTRAPPQGQGDTVSPEWEEPPGWRSDVSESGVGPGIIQGQDVEVLPAAGTAATNREAGSGTLPTQHQGRGGACTGTGTGGPRPGGPQGRADAEPQGGRGRPTCPTHADLHQARGPGDGLPAEP